MTDSDPPADEAMDRVKTYWIVDHWLHTYLFGWCMFTNTFAAIYGCIVMDIRGSRCRLHNKPGTAIDIERMRNGVIA